MRSLGVGGHAVTGVEDGLRARRAASVSHAVMALWAVGCICIALCAAAPTAMALRRHVFCPSCGFGSEGAGNGQFSGPSGVAVSAIGATAGQVYVVDRGNNRVERFSAAGEYLGQFNAAAAPTGPLLEPEGVAVDNSGSLLDPSSGDVYVTDVGHHVVDKFSATGGYLSQISTGEAGAPLGELLGVSVDEFGSVWLYQGNDEIDTYTGGEPNELSASRVSLAFGFAQPGITIGTEERIFVVTRGLRVLEELETLGGVIKEELGAQVEVAGLASESQADRIYLSQLTHVSVLDPAGNVFEQFGEGHLTESSGVGINQSTGAVYVADKVANTIQVFEASTFPDVQTGSATSLEPEGAATLTGSVNPDGLPVTACSFEYGTTTAYGATAECSPEPGAGTEAVSVAARLAGLSPGTVYHYRLVALNANGENTGIDQAFTTPAQPSVASEAVSGITAGEAVVGAAISPGGLPTSYVVEYGTTTAYGTTTPSANVGAGFEPVGTQVRLSGLSPATAYHARVVAHNKFGTIFGNDIAFTTTSASEKTVSALPDGRVYEAVSPVETEGNATVYVPWAGQGYLTTQGEHGIYTPLPFRAATSGEAAVYAGDPPPTGGGGSAGVGLGDEYISKRVGPGVWSAEDLQPINNFQAKYEAFSSDLSLGVLESTLSILPGRPGELYTHESAPGSAFTPVNPVTTPVAPEQFIAINAGATGVPPGAHNVFESSEALLQGEGTQATELREAVAAARGEGHQPHVLYDSVSGTLQLVSVLPNGKPDVYASAGEDPLRIVSRDGSRIFWTDTNSEATAENPGGGTRLFVRSDDSLASAKTTQLDVPAAGASGSSGNGKLWSASTDGSRVFFTDASALTSDATAAPEAADLYEANLESGTLVDLTVDSNPGGHAGVQGILGVSADGSYVYFAANGALAQGAEPQECEAGGCNVYVRHGGVTSLIAVASAEDNFNVVPFDGLGEQFRAGDWRAASGFRTTQLNADGTSLVFMSSKSLTGYTNEGLTEVFDYEAPTGHLRCLSCDVTGKAPVKTNFDNYHGRIGGFIPIARGAVLGNSEAPRAVTEDGGRVFFDSGEPLVPQDSNGWLDVYEWERDGTGSCHQAEGCIFLLTPGSSPESSYLLGSSANGNDVFVITRAQLTPQDRNDNDDVYDARVGGSQLPTGASGCTGEACAHIPPVPPSFSAPSSATLEGSGNPPHAKPPAPKSPSQAQKLAKALRLCRATHRRRKPRARCEREARRHFGSTGKAHGTTKRRKR
jgi:hypothetical protein